MKIWRVGFPNIETILNITYLFYMENYFSFDLKIKRALSLRYMFIITLVHKCNFPSYSWAYSIEHLIHEQQHTIIRFCSKFRLTDNINLQIISNILHGYSNNQHNRIDEKERIKNFVFLSVLFGLLKIY